MDLAKIPERNILEAGALPFGDLVRFATREGRRPRPIYQIHKWFARRLGSSFRAVLVGAVSVPTADFWRAYYETASLRGLTVLDPFVGGGTSVVEAARLGASAIGVDVDPIACAITDAELTAADLEDLRPTLRSLQESTAPGSSRPARRRFQATLATSPKRATSCRGHAEPRAARGQVAVCVGEGLHGWPEGQVATSASTLSSSKNGAALACSTIRRASASRRQADHSEAPPPYQS